MVGKIIPVKDAAIIFHSLRKLRGEENDSVEWTSESKLVSIQYAFNCRAGLNNDSRIHEAPGPSVVVPLDCLPSCNTLTEDILVVNKTVLQETAREFLGEGELKIDMLDEHIANMDMTILKCLCFEVSQAKNIDDQLNLFQNLCLMASAVKSHQESSLIITQVISALQAALLSELVQLAKVS